MELSGESDWLFVPEPAMNTRLARTAREQRRARLRDRVVHMLMNSSLNLGLHPRSDVERHTPDLQLLATEMCAWHAVHCTCTRSPSVVRAMHFTCMAFTNTYTYTFRAEIVISQNVFRQGLRTFISICVHNSFPSMHLQVCRFMVAWC